MCCGLEIPDFKQFLLWVGVVVLKELIFTVYTLGVCGVLERTNFSHFLLLGGCGGHERTVF